ncbi:transforming growth factor beta receptor type 3 [Conger conger]|uniref:transforming growth factor beta receptor type 3 n=1 Tax=Conger conger TaxID=82655 RepID=UPI002A5A5211|nr:transforming growth factor beta receptor type 3 [Conger conger]XP_061080472.1 transforming growth factor beta receptor type 3 [Conger conger]XP_061080473.1 transforming growth factor beta receptor type 3 [Conger conger]XP_061080474.1 transforming growth factor beta receptor type 3 [Conger conger]XP_061080475.1 transforming growth factor beta receptor type 3 [Conger conger]XP_061080476.1 transforming growth factor beta receptor type 3 [Conger conger]
MVWKTKLTLLCLLLLGTGTAECSAGVHCPVCPVGALHPVRGFLESFGVGPGCAARETEGKETHVISVGRAPPGSEKQVTVILRPLYFSRPPNRTLALVLSSQNLVHWHLEGEHLPASLSILAQVAPPSTVQSRNVAQQVALVSGLPWRPQDLLRWSLEQHGAVSSLTHAPIANRVYIRLGDDPTMPSVCTLRSLFLSRSYLTSDLQPKGVQGCVPTGPGRDPEVHLIRLLSAGSARQGSLQVEVSVSLLPPVAGAGWYRVVLILSSGAPVNWVLTAKGLRGQVSVYSSNSVSPLYPAEPSLTLTSIPSHDLPTHDLLGWANRRGFPKVTSYTEADLANRFVIRLAGGGTDGRLSPRAPVVWPQRPLVEMQERSLREWLVRWGDWPGRSREPMDVQCRDGQLSVAMDSSILQSLSPAVKSVSLRERGCEAQSNGSHFLLEFPVISCGTEAVMEAQPRGVLYKNMVLLWRSGAAGWLRNETETSSWLSPLIIHFSCFVAVPVPPTVPEVTPFPQEHEDPLSFGDPADGAGPGVTVFALRLFGTEEFLEKTTGPCAIMANNRVYVEVSVNGVEQGAVEVHSCVVSPLSDPDASPGWAVIQGGCLVEPTLRQIGKAGVVGADGREGARALRFSFVLRPRYMNPLQFLHCKLHYCKEGPPGAPTQDRCQGRPRLPPLIAQPHGQQCEYRYLLRPMLVTLPLGRAQPPPLSGPEVDPGSVVGVSFAAFLIGIILMGTLWCIYTRTGHPARVTLPHRRGILQEPVDQTIANWTPPNQVEQSVSFM